MNCENLSDVKIVRISNEIYNCSPAGIYLFKVNNRNTGTRCEICSKLTIKTPECVQVNAGRVSI